MSLRLVALITILCSSAAFADAAVPSTSLFDSIKDCKENSFLGFYWLCSARVTTVHTITPTQTTNSFIKAMPFNLRLIYAFSCDSSQHLTSTVESRDQNTAMILESERDAPVRSSPMISTPYDGSDLTITVSAPSDNVIIRAGTCRFDLFQAITIPSVSSLEWYLRQIKKSISGTLEVRQAIENAAELPAKWNYVTQVPELLKRQSSAFQQDLADLQGELNDLKSRKQNGEILSISENERLTSLTSDGGIIAVKQAQIENVDAKIPQIQSALSIASRCDSAPEASCLAVVQSVVALLNPLLSDAQSSLKELSDFTRAEITRIGDSDVAVHESLNGIAGKILTVTDHITIRPGSALPN